MKVAFPNEAQKLFTSFSFYQPLVGLASVLDNFDFTDVDLRDISCSVLGRDPESWLQTAASDYPPSQFLKEALECEEFQQNIVRLILNAYPEKRRLIHIHIPKCAGTHLRARLEVKYPTVCRALEAAIWTPKPLLFETLHDIAISIPLCDAIFVHGHTSIPWYLEHKLCRPSDFVFTVVRNPLEIVVSQVNYVVTRFLEDPGFLDPDTSEWSGLLGLTPTEFDRSPKGLANLARRILRKPSVLTRNPLCEYLGDGNVESALNAIVRANIEITDVSRYDLWFEQKFAIATGVRENVSQKILKLSELELEDIKVLQDLTNDQDKRLYEIISAALDRSGALSVQGAELRSDRRLRGTRPLTVCRRSSGLWRGLRVRFSIVGRLIRNLLSALRMIDTGSSAERTDCGTPHGCSGGPARHVAFARRENGACSHIERAEQSRTSQRNECRL